MQEFINRRTQTILKGVAKRGHYELPNGSVVVRVETLSTGKPGPAIRMLVDGNGDRIKAMDGSCVRFRLDPSTGRYNLWGEVETVF
jgi:hypothetical protein